MNAGGGAMSARARRPSAARAISTAARQPKAMSDCTTARWVDTAPFGKPVVPDV